MGENSSRNEDDKIIRDSENLSCIKQRERIDSANLRRERQREEIEKIYLRKKISLALQISVLIFYVVIVFSIQLIIDDSFYVKIIEIMRDKSDLLISAVSAFFAVIMGTLVIYFLNNENKKAKELQQAENKQKRFFPLEKDEELFQCMEYVLEKISDYKKINEDKRKELSDTGRSYLSGGVTLYLSCVIIFQIFSYVSPEKELFKIYGMVSCAVIFMIIVSVGIWHLNQAKNYSKNLSKIMNAELAIVKCLLICNLDIDKKEKSDLLRAELVNAEIKNDAKDAAAADIPYKMAFDIFKDMMKKNQ